MAITSGFPDNTTDGMSLTNILLIRMKSIGILKLM